MRSRREALLRIGGSLLAAGAGGWARIGAAGAARDGLPRSGAKSGVNPDAVLAFLDDCAAQHLELDSLMLWHAGAVAAEGWWRPYRPDLVHMLHSATKSFTGTGVGIAIAEGRLSLDDPVLKFFPGRVASPGANLQAMQVRHLLSQTSGHAIGISGSQWRPLATSWVDEFFKVPVPYAPGTHFAYSSATSYMLSAIVTRVTGRSLADYLAPRLFEPMGMRGVRWDVGPEGVNPGGNGLSTTTADFLKLGVLHLTRGRWNGRQLVSPAWIAAATSPQGEADYGYQWWLAPDGLGYYAAGKFGQFCFVFPGLDGIVTVTAGLADNEATRERMHALTFRHAPRLFAAARPDAAANRRLADRVAALRLLAPLQPSSSPLAARVSGRTFMCADNADGVRSVRLVFAGDACRFEMSDARGNHVVVNGLTDWREGDTTITGGYLHHEYEPDLMRIVAGGRWTAPNRFEMTWQFVESGFRDTAALTFDGDQVRYDRSVNINSGPLARPTIVARAVAART